MTKIPRFKAWAARSAALVLAGALLGGCASGPNANPADPFEPYNRSMSRFNDNLDDAVLKPVATAYRDVTPQPVRTGVGNFFSNLGDAWSFVNNMLQLRGREAFDSMVRFSVNSVLGPSTVRDTAALPVDFYVGDLVDHVHDIPVRNSMYGLRAIDKRAQLLGAGTVLDEAALDPYSFTRDVYLKLRAGASGSAEDGKLPEDY